MIRAGTSWDAKGHETRFYLRIEADQQNVLAHPGIEWDGFYWRLGATPKVGLWTLPPFDSRLSSIRVTRRLPHADAPISRPPTRI